VTARNARITGEISDSVVEDIEKVVNRGLQVMEELKLRLRAEKYQPSITATLDNLASLYRQILSKAPAAPSRPPPKQRTEDTWTDRKDVPKWRKRWWRLELISKLRLGMEEANARDNAAKKDAFWTKIEAKIEALIVAESQVTDPYILFSYMFFRGH